MLKAIQCQPLTPNLKHPPKPKYNCSSCSKLSEGNYCNCFQRPVHTTRNKCWNHSNYISTKTVFKVAPNVDEMAAEKERQRYA